MTTTRSLLRQRKFSACPGVVAFGALALSRGETISAAWLVLAAWLPEAWLGEIQFQLAHPGPHHDEHLLSALVAPLQLLPRAVTCALFAAGILCSTWTMLKGARGIARRIAHLGVARQAAPPEALAVAHRSAMRHGFELLVLDTRTPLCFVWGLRRPAVVVSSGLAGMLVAGELRGVLAHEAAHRRRGDNVAKLLLTLAGTATLAWPLARRVSRWYSEQVELICDEIATLETAAPLDIAGALVKVRRLATAPAQGSTAPFFGDQVGGFERRVRRLLAFVDAPPARARATRLSRTGRGGVVPLGLVFSASLVAVSAAAPLAVHGTAELLLRVFR
jgi:Zn-dependent protease with chaperone function